MISGSKKIGILLYADDIVFLASSTRAMRKLCEIVEKWLMDFNLNINADKSISTIFQLRASVIRRIILG